MSNKPDEKVTEAAIQGLLENEDGKWRYKLESREERLKYLENGERYWYGKESYGSEKRKTPA
ncbi:hypothetical protein ACFLXP_04145 [Chloroflexota bacterium]